MTKEKLTNGKYWLVIAKYPFPGFETYTLIKVIKIQNIIISLIRKLFQRL